MRFSKTAAAATLVLAGLTAASGAAWADPTPTPTPSTGPAPGPTASAAASGAAEAPAPAAAPGSISSDGTFTVGRDVAPGNYSSAGPTDNGACYWKRIGVVDGKDTIIDNAMSKQPQLITIDPTDTKFKTSGCQPWQPTDQAPPVQQGGLGGLGALLAQSQLRDAFNTINNGARQYDGSSLPTP